MYGRFAEIYDALYSNKDYQAETDRIREIIGEKCPSAKTLLDVGCGTGAHLAYLAASYDCVGVDHSDEQLAGARTKLPDLELRKEDMRAFELDRQFDVLISLFSTVGYCQSREELNQTVKCFEKHLAPGGVMIVEPWLTKDAFKPGTYHIMTGEMPGMKIARGNTSRREGHISILEFAFGGKRRGYRALYGVSSTGSFFARGLRKRF